MPKEVRRPNFPIKWKHGFCELSTLLFLLTHYSQHSMVTPSGNQRTNGERWKVPASSGTDKNMSFINTCVQSNSDVQAALKSRDCLGEAISIVATEKAKVRMRVC